MIIHAKLFLFNKIMILHVIKILFKSSDFYSVISAVLLFSGSTLKKNMAAIVQVTWKDILSSFDNLLMESAEIQDTIGLHEALLLLNRLEMAVSVLSAIVDMNLDLDRNFGQFSKSAWFPYRYIPILGSKSK